MRTFADLLFMLMGTHAVKIRIFDAIFILSWTVSMPLSGPTSEIISTQIAFLLSVLRSLASLASLSINKFQ